MKDKTLVLGASLKPQRYSNLAINRLRNNKVKTRAVGLRKGVINDVIINTGKPVFTDIHTITLYLNKKRQKDYYNYIIDLMPNRVIFNPGTENEELMNLLSKNNIDFEIACTLTLLATNQY